MNDEELQPPKFPCFWCGDKTCHGNHSPDFEHGYRLGMREGFDIAKREVTLKVVADRAKATWDYARRELKSAIRLRGGDR
jgi:hypothetical protein